MEYYISSDKSKLDITEIHQYLCHTSYWAKGRSFNNVKKSIDNALCFGIYDKSDKMLGFCRVLTDSVAFAYLMDVFIVEEYQGVGLGTKLVKHAIEHPNCQVKTWFLGTMSAHRLYKKLGFTNLPDPSRFMIMKNDSIC